MTWALIISIYLAYCGVVLMFINGALNESNRRDDLDGDTGALS